MRLATTIIAALFAAPLWAVVPMPVPEVQVVKRVSVEGFVRVATGWQWNGEQSRIDIDNREPTDESRNWTGPLARLVFADDRTYREALRNDGFIVRVEGVEVVRGSEVFLLVESVRTVTLIPK